MLIGSWCVNSRSGRSRVGASECCEQAFVTVSGGELTVASGAAVAGAAAGASVLTVSAGVLTVAAVQPHTAAAAAGGVLIVSAGVLAAAPGAAHCCRAVYRDHVQCGDGKAVFRRTFFVPGEVYILADKTP